MGNFKKRIEGNLPWLQKMSNKVKELLDWFARFLTLKNFIVAYITYMALFLLVTYIKSDDLVIGICFSESCLSSLSEKYSTFISLTEGIVTTLAIVIAARSLKLSQDSFQQAKANNEFNNHIANKKFFNEFIDKEIKESSYISRSSVDINKYYHFMFPLSSQGNFTLNKKYEDTLLLLKRYLIQTSNASKKATAFDFKKHQVKVAKILKDFGFDLVNLPRRDFNLVESEVFKLIDAVTILMTSFEKKHLLCEVDIHYR